MRAESQDRFRRLVDQGLGFVLLARGRPVSTTAFNATVPDMVQVGGVFTPPQLRGRGYTRTIVAHSLVDATRQGATRAVLFAARGNGSSQRAYRALGFEQVGPFRLTVFPR